MTFEMFRKSTYNLIPQHKVKIFSGGEPHVELDQVRYESNYGVIDFFPQVAVVRGASGEDYFKLAMWNDAVERASMERCRRTLMLPYLPAGRADRVTSMKSEALGCKIYADFINSLNFDLVLTVDPHSDVAPALYRNLKIIKISDLFNQIQKRDHIFNQFVGYIAPDLGADKRLQCFDDWRPAAFCKPIYRAIKKRDFKTHELSDFEMLDQLPPWGKLLMVDDICDGGRTFMGIAEQIGLPRERLGLWTTHGIYSYNCVPKLAEKFSWIGCTDSHPGSQQLVEFEDPETTTYRFNLLNYLNHLI